MVSGLQANTFNGTILTKATVGECKTYMAKYLSCMKKVRGLNDEECRDLAKAYLSCRMDSNGYFRNLMARDEFKNLGFTESPPPSAVKATLEGDKGAKG
ncbi:unnamed protein product [Fusarium fujikuroi]|uniref:Cytochrome c oxidase assembly protein COX19 n=1 Tax=Fusarium fujikuroi TaxID=5127 RepID=A0A9Q9U8W7_FUSFU|nr:unnamed protein product [Fusarium fujikuroi]VZH93575.1 unnamed protein product [Fusarium fujikuroi]